MIQVDFDGLANISFIDLHFLDFYFVLWQNSPDIVAEFDNDAVFIDSPYDSAVLFFQIHLFHIKKHVTAFNELLIISYFDNFIPNIKTENFELGSFSFAEDFEIVERYFLGNFAYSKTKLPARHYLIPFEIVVLFDPELRNIINFWV